MNVAPTRLFRSRFRVAIGLALVLFGTLPLVALDYLGGYTVGLLITVMILTLFATSFNLLFGYTGLLSFGHAAYFGVAAYVLGILLSGRLDLVPESLGSIVPAAALAVLVAGSCAAAFGLLCVQRGEIYFAMLTLAFNMMLYQVAYQWDDVTGGANGITVSPPPLELAGITVDFLDTVTFYYLTFSLLVLSLAVLWRIVHSPYGALLVAISENPDRAEMIGVPVKRYQLSSFVIAGTFAGIAGVLFSVRNFIVTPGTLHWSMSAEPVLITLLGGPSSFFGPAIGAFMFVFLEEWLTGITEFWQIGLGLVLVPIVLFVPGGLVGLVTGDGGTPVRSLLGRNGETDAASDAPPEDD
ncbi:branched-chain amino acid ABC transporter permease [Halomarina halobia]|uniref:Branched-chain amino acid ABC transporter permease n=1 Tax=Halomarina halobia TaxID=3033386 RepID=A0ABD6AFB5_9EURY|nr:branched-chain amino acid ABC transporter permease [Halomarina sp. PSR21]